MRARRVHSRRGFTAVELLAATALTAVLMVTLLHVIGSIGRGREAMRRRDAGEPLRSEVLDALRWDLANARTAGFWPSGLTLAGAGALDRDTLAPRHRTVEVIYAVERIAGRPWLVRRQVPDADAPGAWAELLCPDVLEFLVEPHGVRIARPRQPLSPPLSLSVGLPDRVRVRMVAADGVVLDEELVLR